MKALVLIPLLAGCSTAAIQVTESEGQCTLAGALFAPTLFEQSPPEAGEVDYDFVYEGDKCGVRVRNGEVSP